MTMFLFQYCYPYLAKRYPVKVPVQVPYPIETVSYVQGRSVILVDPLHVWTSCSKVVGALPKVSHIDVRVCSP